MNEPPIRIFPSVCSVTAIISPPWTSEEKSITSPVADTRAMLALEYPLISENRPATIKLPSDELVTMFTLSFAPFPISNDGSSDPVIGSMRAMFSVFLS